MVAGETTMTVYRQLPEFLKWRYQKTDLTGKSIGLISTKGAIHPGHLSLIKAARQQCHLVIVTIFLFEGQCRNDKEYSVFPRQITEDLECLRESSMVDVVLLPKLNEIFKFGPNHGARVRLHSDLVPKGYVQESILEAEATYLLKLINLMQPSRIYLGEKDLVRSRITQRLLDDLHLTLDVITLPTMRRDDGIAHDARLSLLAPGHLDALTAVYRALRVMIMSYLDENFDVKDLVKRGRGTLDAEPLLEVGFVRIAHPFGLHNVVEKIDPAIGAIAIINVKVADYVFGDNAILAPMIPRRENSIWNLVKSAVVPKEDPAHLSEFKRL